MRLEQELAESRARERRARYEATEMRERFERLLDASKRFTRTLSDRRRQLLTSRQHLLIHHASTASSRPPASRMPPRAS